MSRDFNNAAALFSIGRGNKVQGLLLNVIRKMESIHTSEKNKKNFAAIGR